MNEALDGDRLVRLDVVPDQDDPPAHVTQQMPQKDEDLRRGDGSTANQDVQLTPVADPGDRGELRPAIAVPDDRCLAFRSPGPSDGRTFADATLVLEDDPGLSSLGVFLLSASSSPPTAG